MIEDEAGEHGGLPPAARLVCNLLASLMTLAAIAYALDVHIHLALPIYPAQFFAAMLSLALPLAFLSLPFDRAGKRTRVPVIDWILALVSGLAMGYLTVEYQQFVDMIMLSPPKSVAAGLVIILLSLEGLRRSTGNTLPLISIAFIAYAVLGHLLPGNIAAQHNDWMRLTGYLTLDVNGILGVPLAVASTIVIAFLLFGALLNQSGGSHFFTDIAMLTMGRFRGGPAKIAVVGSMLFGSVSGSAVANVVATGVVTIPLIKRGGYPAHRAAAIEAVASTGGQLMPPVMGATAFLMAEFLNVPYADVVLAAIIPALIYYVALFIQADLEAARMGLAGLEKHEMPPKWATLGGIYFIIPFAVLIVALFNFNQTPALSALLGAVVLVVMSLVFGYRGQRPGWRDFLASIKGAGYQALDIIMVCVAAGIVIGVLGISGLGFNLTLALVHVGEGSLLLLLLLAAGICILLGMGLPTVGVYVLLAALVAPALVKVGVEPMAAHMYVMYFGMMSMITPPVAIAAFAAASIAKANPMATGWSAVRFGWTAYVVPFLFVLSPTLLMIGKPGDIFLATVTALAGVWLVSIALSGYLVRSLSVPMRVAFAVAGLLALLPANSFPGAWFTDLIGTLSGLALIANEFLARKRLAVSPVTT